jgi:predicted phosphoribosyltransferase
MTYLDRNDAGRRLAERLRKYTDRPGCPGACLTPRGSSRGIRGGARGGGAMALNEDVVGRIRITPETIKAVVAIEQRELERREPVYLARRPAPEVAEHTLILVDDGLATGATMRAPVLALRRRGARRIASGLLGNWGDCG